MEQQSSTSKVTVEYFDPHHVFKLLAPGLVPRLPLRNLHWQSHAGPLRSIDTLHVDLVSGDAAESLEPAAPNSRRSTNASRDDGFQTQQVGGQAGSTETVDKQAAATKVSSPGQRRHQIPGLRSTPYLKVLLVRCDDNDSYKATVRTEIREWIKEHTPPSSSAKKASNQEKHDAFEWLILHVVIPNTTAATQPRNTGSKGEGGTTEKAPTTSRWRPGSTPLMEKLRSDFNSSSKGAPDRVAQIRIGINDVPYDLLPRVVPAVPSGYTETEQDAENAWKELLSKFKSLILSSFDMRVTQYEEDIKEKDGQRSLPGWNFCTFFILKEGLARGFENVGLVEDALVGYDELSVGLDTVIQEQVHSGVPEKHGGAMLTYTEELQRAARRALTELSGDAADEEAVDLQRQETISSDTSDIPIASSKKAYRDMILANKVSVFDFRCYIFSRQISLLLRLGNALATREELLAKLMDQRDSILHGVAPLIPPMNNDDGLENLGMLSEVCRRALEFIPAISHVMRQDITASLLNNANSNTTGNTPATTLDPLLLEAMDNMVASFSFTIAQQILAQTSTKALPIPPPNLAMGDGAEPKSSIPEPKTMLHPARSSSLHAQPSPRPPPSPGFPGPGRQPSLAEPESSSFLKVGLEELAARRAELYMLSRNILEGLGKKRGWSNGWDEAPLVGESGLDGMEEISLDDDGGDGGSNITSKSSSQSTAPSVAGIDSQILRTSTDNAGDFYRLYEILTYKANHHFVVANHVHAVKACTADLAILKVHLKEYKAATSYFEQATPFFAENGWSLLELSLLVMYCQCLSELGSNDHYVNVSMTLLIKSCAAERERREQMSAVVAPPKTSILGDSPIKQVAAKLFALASNLSSEVKVPLSKFFMDVELEGTPIYHDRKDGCSLKIQLRSLLPEKLTLDSAKLRITCTNGGPRRDINFDAEGNIVLYPGWNSISLVCNSVIPGSYRVSRLALVSSKILLHHEQDINSLPPQTSSIFREPDVTLFQRTNALDVQLTASKHISLGKNNALDLAIRSGWNSLQSCEVKIRPTTGGLRLLTAEAKLVDESIKFAKPPESGALFFGPVEEEKSITVRLPYSIEQDLGDVSVRVEVTYVTTGGESFQLAKSILVPVSLAVGVNVQDVFKHNALFSRFNVDTASSSPLRLFKSELVASELFESSFGIPPANTVMVFPKQHATLLYKVKRKGGDKGDKGAKGATRSGRKMHLKLYYSVLQTEIEERIQESVLEGLRDTPLELYSKVTAARVLEETRNGLQAHDLERAALVGEVTTSYLDKVRWAHLLRGLGCVPGTNDDATTKLAEYLDDWQSKHPRMAMPTYTPDEPWSIVIPVEVPSLSVVHTADIRIDQTLLDHFEGPSAGAPAACVNQVLPATLHLKWTRIWDTDAVARDDEEFSYEVTAPSDTWLIGGRRRGHFVIPGGKTPSTMTSTAETEAEIPLVLIPQREGYLPYPTVEIKDVPPAEGHKGAASTPAPCEVDWRNLGETVRVVSERRSVTVSLDASGPGGGPLVCESEGMGRQKGRIVA